jgi:hypothetical protein
MLLYKLLISVHNLLFFTREHDISQALEDLNEDKELDRDSSDDDM